MDSNSNDLSIGTPAAYRHKRARVSRACDQCRKKKIRCDADKSTPCSNCSAYGFGCTFLDSAKKRGPPKGYIEALENRLKRMEGLLGGLVNEGGKKRKLKTLAGNLYEEPEEDIEGTEENDEDEEEEEYEFEETEDPKDITQKWRTQSASSVSSRGARSTGNHETLDQATVLSSPPPSPEEPEHVEDINEGLEKLSMKDYTQTCYVGNSSGLYLFMSQFESKDGIYHLSKDHPLLRGLDVSVKQENPDDARTITVEEYEDANNLNGSLSNKLIGIYFSVVHPLFPILNKIHFLKQYRGELSSGPPSMLRYAVLAVASRYLPKGENAEIYGQIFYEQASTCLGQAYMHPRISTVQALLLMMLYHRGTPNGSRNWLDCGLAIRMSQDLGLHRSSSQWKIPKSEIETRKRVWWTCYIMDRWNGAVLGRPFAINDDDCDVEYPSIYDESEDEDISTPPTKRLGSFSPESSPPMRKPNHGHMAFVELIKISEILGRILLGLYTPKARARRSGHDKIIKNLDDLLTNWKDHLPVEFRQTDGKFHSKDNVLYAGIVQLCYYTAVILLNRPYIPSQKSGSPRPSAPLRICTCAANDITKIAQIFQSRNHFDSIWPFTVYHTFQSSLIHLHNVSNSSKDLSRLGKTNLQENIKVLESVDMSFHASRKIVVLLKMLSQMDIISVNQEPAEGGFWINVNKEMTCGASNTSTIARSLTPRSQSTSQSPNLPTPYSDVFEQTNSSPASINTEQSIFLPTSIPLSTSSISSTSPLMDSPGSVSFLNEVPVYSLRQLIQPEPEIPVSQLIAPLVQPASFDQDMSFTFDLNNTTNIELPNELFRIEQTNPFFSMPSTYNPEDWDVWMFGQGATNASA